MEQKKIKHVIYVSAEGTCREGGLNTETYAAILEDRAKKVGESPAKGWGKDFNDQCVEWRIGEYAWTFITPSWVKTTEDLKGLL